MGCLLPCAPRDSPSAHWAGSAIARPKPTAPGTDAPGAVARSDVDVRPGSAGQLGGPMHGHDGGHGAVDAPGGVLRLLGQPGAPGVLAQDGVGDMPGQGGPPSWVSSPSTTSW